MSNYFFPLVESFIQEAEDSANGINPLDVDAAADIYGLMRAFGESLQTGQPFVPPPEHKAPLAKAGRVQVDPVAKRDDWDQVIDAPTPVTKATTDYIRHRDMTDEEKADADVKDAAYCKLIDAGVSAEDARKIVFA
jgi:hypothetical protein